MIDFIERYGSFHVINKRKSASLPMTRPQNKTIFVVELSRLGLFTFNLGRNLCFFFDNNPSAAFNFVLIDNNACIPCWDDYMLVCRLLLHKPLASFFILVILLIEYTPSFDIFIDDFVVLTL